MEVWVICVHLCMEKKIKIKLGDSFAVMQNEFGSISGIMHTTINCANNIIIDGKNPVYYFGQPMKMIGRLIVKSLKNI